MLAGRAGAAAGDPEPGPAGPPAEAPPPAQGRQPRPLRHRLPLGGRGRDRERASSPPTLYLVERSEYGPFIGTPLSVDGRRPGDRRRGAEAVQRPCRELVAKAAARPRGDSKRIEKGRDRGVNYAHRAGPARAPQARLTASSRTRRATSRPSGRRSTSASAEQKARYAELEEKLAKLQAAVARARRHVVFRPSTARRRSCARSTSTGPTRRTGSRWPGSAGHLREPPVGVPERRAARVQHRGRHLPGDLRHRDDGAS